MFRIILVCFFKFIICTYLILVFKIVNRIYGFINYIVVDLLCILKITEFGRNSRGIDGQLEIALSISEVLRIFYTAGIVRIILLFDSTLLLMLHRNIGKYPRVTVL